MAAEVVESTWWGTKSRHSPEDAIVIALHSLLLSKDCTCTSLSDEGFTDASSSETALCSADKPSLPDGWNSADVYTLLFRHNTSGRKVLVKGIKMEGDMLILNMAADNSDTVANVTVTPSDHVNADKLTTVTGAFKDLSQLLSLLDQELVSSVLPKEKAPTSTTAGQESASRKVTSKESRVKGEDRGFSPPPDPMHDPLRVGPPRGPRGRVPPYGSHPFSVGHGDLDPFGGMGLGVGGGGGGMMMDPFQSGRLGGVPDFRGPTVPPGARFDPYGPFPSRPGLGGRPRPPHGGEPDPDHLPPPGYDDMFM